jgi:hypothetical protein
MSSSIVRVPGSCVELIARSDDLEITTRDQALVLERYSVEAGGGRISLGAVYLNTMSPEAFGREWGKADAAEPGIRKFLRDCVSVVDAREYTDGVLAYDVLLVRVDGCPNTLCLCNVYDGIRGNLSMLFEYGYDTGWKGFGLRRASE